MARPLKKDRFFAASLTDSGKYIFKLESRGSGEYAVFSSLNHYLFSYRILRYEMLLKL